MFLKLNAVFIANNHCIIIVILSHYLYVLVSETKLGALSICVEKPVVPVGNQMERAFPLEIFRKKRNTFSGIPLFPVSRPLNDRKISVPFATTSLFAHRARFDK